MTTRQREWRRIRSWPARVGWSGLCGGGLLLAAVVTAGVAFAERAPRVAVQLLPAAVDLGVVREGSRVDVQFAAVNRTSGVQKLRVKSTCACSAPEPGEMVLEAGARVDVKVTVDTLYRPGKNQAMILLLDAGGREVAAASLLFDSVPGIVLEPACLDLSRGQQSVTVYSVTPSPAEGLTVVSSSSACQASLARVATRRWQLRAVVGSSPGPETCYLDVRDAQGRSLGGVSVFVPGSVDVDHRTTYVPRRVGERRRTWVHLRPTAGAVECIERVTDAGIDLVGEEAGLAGGRWLELDFGPEAIGRRVEIACRLRTGEPGGPEEALRRVTVQVRL